MTAGEDVRPLSRTAAVLGWRAGRPSTQDRGSRGPDLIDLLGLVGPVPGAPAGVELVVFETLCVPRQLRTPAYAAALGAEGGEEDGAVLPATRFFVHEAALHTRVGDAGVLAEQWRAVAGREDAVVRLVPFAAGCAGLLRAPFALPVGAHPADLLDRIALDVPSSRAEFHRRAEVLGAEVLGAEVLGGTGAVGAVGAGAVGAEVLGAEVLGGTGTAGAGTMGAGAAGAFGAEA